MIARSRDNDQSNRATTFREVGTVPGGGSLKASGLGDGGVSRPPEIGFVLHNWLPRRHRPPPALRTAPAGAANWVRFAQSALQIGFVLHISPSGDRPTGEIGFVCTTSRRKARGRRGEVRPAPPGNWLRFVRLPRVPRPRPVRSAKLGLFCTIVPHPARPRREIGFVWRDRPAKSVGCVPRTAACPRACDPQIGFVCTTPHGPRPSGLEPPGAAGNWLCFSRPASPPKLP
jgi:hypothetical protein